MNRLLNFVDVDIEQQSDGQVFANTSCFGRLPLPGYDPVDSNPKQLGLRPQYIGLGEGLNSNHRFEAEVGASERLGSETLINLKTSDGEKLTAVLPEDIELVEGESALFNFDSSKLRIFAI